MPQLIDLQQLPNQSLEIILGGRRYDITLTKTTEIMVADIYRDGDLVISGMRCLPDYPVIPYQYMEDASGNFVFVTQNDEFPDYTQFGVTQYFFYVSNDELEAARVGT